MAGALLPDGASPFADSMDLNDRILFIFIFFPSYSAHNKDMHRTIAHNKDMHRTIACSMLRIFGQEILCIAKLPKSRSGRRSFDVPHRYEATTGQLYYCRNSGLSMNWFEEILH